MTSNEPHRQAGMGLKYGDGKQVRLGWVRAKHALLRIWPKIEDVQRKLTNININRNMMQAHRLHNGS